ELVLLQEHVGIAIDLVALDPILLRDFLAGLGVDDLVADTVSGLAVDDVEADALARRRGGKQLDRARHQRKLQITFPIRTRCHDATLAPERPYTTTPGITGEFQLPAAAGIEPPTNGRRRRRA